MAFVPDANDPNAQPQVAPALNQPPQTATTGGAGAGAGGPQGSTAVPNATKAPPVQDLHAYLEANAPQSVQMGQNIAGNLNTQGQTVTGDINTAGQNFQNEVTAGTVAPNPDLVTSAAANPAAFVQNPGNVTAFQGQENAAYTGPAAFETSPGYSAINQEVTNAAQAAPDITKPGGIDQLVRGQETNPTAGMSALDSLLLQETPEAQAPIKAALPQFAALNPQLAGTATAEDAAIQKAIADTAAAKAGSTTPFLTGPNATVPAFESNLNQEMTGNQKAVADYNVKLNDLINQENTVNPLLSNLKTSVGAFNNQMANIYPALPKIPLTVGNLPENPSAITNLPGLAESATPQDIATEKALETLLGGNYNPAFNTTGATPFQAPSSIPTLKSEVDPILQQLLFNPQQPVQEQKLLFQNPDLINSIGAIQKALGETPVTLSDNTSLIPIGVTPGQGVFGSGMSVNPKTGQIIS